MKKHTLKTALLLASMAAIMLGAAAFPPAAKAQMTKVWETGGHDSPRFSYDGKKIIGFGGGVKILDTKDGKMLFSVSAQNDADISYDGRWLAVMHPYKGKDQWNQPEYYNYVAIYDIESDFKLVDSVPLKANPRNYNNACVVRFSPDGKKLYTISFIYPGKTLTVFDIATKKELYSQACPNSNRLEVSSDGKYYVVSVRDNYKYGTPPPPRYARIYDAATNKELYKIDIGREELDEIKNISKDNKLYTRTINSIRVYDLNDKGKEIAGCKVFFSPGYAYQDFCFIKDNCLISYFEGGDFKNGIIAEYDVLSCKEINKFAMDYTYFLDSYNDEYFLATYAKDDTSFIAYIGLFTYNGSVVENKGYTVNIPETVKEDILKLRITLDKSEYLKICLLDSSGKDIGIIKEGYFEGENDIEHNIKDLSQGIYFVQINDISYKFMVVR